MPTKFVLILFLLPLAGALYILSTSLLGVVGSAFQLILGMVLVGFIIWILVRLLSTDTKS